MLRFTCKFHFSGWDECSAHSLVHLYAMQMHTACTPKSWRPKSAIGKQLQTTDRWVAWQGIHWVALWLAWLLLIFSATAPAWTPWTCPAILLEPLVSATMHLPGSTMPLCQTPGTSSTIRSPLHCYSLHIPVPTHYSVSLCLKSVTLCFISVTLYTMLILQVCHVT